MANWPNLLTGITAGALGASLSVFSAVTMATADISQADGAPSPSWAKYLMAWADAAFRVNYGAPVAAATGVPLPANQPMMFPIGPSVGDQTAYCLSSTTLSIAYLAYLGDL